MRPSEGGAFKGMGAGYSGKQTEAKETSRQVPGACKRNQIPFFSVLTTASLKRTTNGDSDDPVTW